ncbi:hypothetical protein MSAN_00779100 [Mycena sanguinolenta]|uniref:Uncharacterized protein n=1 Tax=Mycena sanguinolenta TaxID=230812 RepID=A0A8H6Z354_9AGAR|nr:hypothetical protein MSAN_00779100 [Mycena sanguinolenta]
MQRVKGCAGTGERPVEELTKHYLQATSTLKAVSPRGGYWDPARYQQCSIHVHELWEDGKEEDRFGTAKFELPCIAMILSTPTAHYVRSSSLPALSSLFSPLFRYLTSLPPLLDYMTNARRTDAEIPAHCCRAAITHTSTPPSLQLLRVRYK